MLADRHTQTCSSQYIAISADADGPARAAVGVVHTELDAQRDKLTMTVTVELS